MERRFVAWLAISFGILILYLNVFGPGRQPPPQDEQPRQAADARDLKDPDQAGAEADAPIEGAPPEPIEVEPADDVPRADVQPPVAVDVPLQYVTLGSVDPQGSYRMALTLTNEGAAVIRGELADTHYRDLHDSSGYLGNLEPSDAPQNGALVRIVVAGTPAETAGLRVGDVIKSVNESPLKNAAALTAALAPTKPGDRITLEVERDGAVLQPMEVTLRRPPQEVMRPERENILIREDEAPEFFDAPSFLLTLQQVGELRLDDDQDELPQVNLRNGRWEVVQSDGNEVLFRRILPELDVEVTKHYKLQQLAENESGVGDAPAYHFTLDIAVRNLKSEPQRLAYRLDGPTGLPTEGWWYVSRIGRGWFQSSGLRDVVARFENRPTQQFGARDIAEQEDELKGGRPIAYVGVDSLYFASILIPQKKLTEQWFDKVESLLLEPELEPRDNLSLANVTCRLFRSAAVVEPGQAVRDSYTVFCGPKRPSLLAHYQTDGRPDYALDDLVYYGWFWWVAKPMLGTLHFFYGVVGNYGIAIIILTVIVRACMLPLSLKQARNMAKMQELQPEMQRIAEKYKGDMEKRARAQQDLFRKHNYNPMGGCLMAFIQLPIFVGLYRGLMLDVELRQAPLISEAIRWCSNLGAPDMLLDWSDWMPSFIQGFLGPYFNILPIVTIFLFLLQQKLFMPEPTNEQAAMQQKVMKFMMVFIGFLFYKVASGLCLYFIASSVWGIVERKLIPHPTRPAAAASSTGRTEVVNTGDKKNRGATDRPRPGSNGQAAGKKRSKARRRK